MDSVPFMLFFLNCLLNFRARSCARITWTEKCASVNYCTEKPHNYPSERLKELFARVGVTPINSCLVNNSTQGIGNPSGVTDLQNLCRFNEHYEQVYEIIDQNDKARFVVQIPGIYEFKVTLRTCRNDHRLEELKDRVECKQKYTSLPVLVLSRDKTKLEVARVYGGLPTSCAPVYKNSA